MCPSDPLCSLTTVAERRCVRGVENSVWFIGATTVLWGVKGAVDGGGGGEVENSVRSTCSLTTLGISGVESLWVLVGGRGGGLRIASVPLWGSGIGGWESEVPDKCGVGG